jgi:hypothetical protein
MSTQVTLTLPDGLWERAAVLAQRTGRDVAEVLAETIELSLAPLGEHLGARPVETWSDDEVLSAADTEMPAEEDQRLSELLGRQQETSLTANDEAELRALMQVYQEGLLRKALALREAVRRGLREPPQP